MCEYRGKSSRFFIIIKVRCKWCGDFYVGNNQNTLNITEQQFQDVPPKVMNDENSNSFAAHVPKTFTKTSSPQQCREFIYFYIIFYGKSYWSNEDMQ